MTSICVFEDENWQALRPVTDIRPICSIGVGITSTLTKINAAFPDRPISVHVRDALIPFTRELLPNTTVVDSGVSDATLWINGRVLMSGHLKNAIGQSMRLNSDVMLVAGDTLVALIIYSNLALSAAILKSPCPDSETLIAQLAPHVTRIDVDDVRVIRFPWDLMSGLGEAITADAAQYPLGVIRGQLYSFSVLYNEPNILIGDRSVVEDFVVLDARSGPIVIESDVVIESHSRIDGPAYIGPYSRILGGRIRGSSIGPHCKIAGEMSQCVVAGYSNKGHDGFWGNSYIGYWVNIGANSVTSNLKNTYGSISLNYFGATIDTGQQFLGALVGDHVKLGIGSHLATGSMVGMGSSVYGTSLHSKYIPPFTWGDSGDYRIVDIDPMIVAAARMKARRGQVLGSSEETLLRQWHGERGGV